MQANSCIFRPPGYAVRIELGHSKQYTKLHIVSCIQPRTLMAVAPNMGHVDNTCVAHTPLRHSVSPAHLENLQPLAIGCNMPPETMSGCHCAFKDTCCIKNVGVGVGVFSIVSGRANNHCVVASAPTRAPARRHQQSQRCRTSSWQHLEQMTRSPGRLAAAAARRPTQ